MSQGRKTEATASLLRTLGIDDGRHRCRRSRIDRADAAVGMLAPDEGGVQHAREDEIGDELPAACEQAMIFAPLHRASDEAGRHASVARQPAPRWLLLLAQRGD